jgi:hypothetical protein
VQKEIEAGARRRPGGLVLQAEVEIRAAEGNALLASLGDDLRFVLICSKTTLIKVPSEADEAILVSPSAHKCERCWHYRDDVGHDADHPELCGRCTSTCTAPAKHARSPEPFPPGPALETTPRQLDGLAAIVVLVDQWTKHLVRGALRNGEVIRVTDWFDLVLAFNLARRSASGRPGWQRWFFVRWPR